MRVAIIGAGAIGRTHAEIVSTTDGFTLSAIADPFDGGAKLAAEYGTAHVRDHRELLGADRPDAAIIAAPNELHVPIGLDLVAAGIPVLIEKPIAGSLDQAEKLVAASEAAGVPTLVGHHRRYHPAVVRAKQIIDSGRLGRLTAVSVTYFLSKPDEYFETGWHATPGSGGTFLINLIHEIDLLRYLIGEITAVSAMASHAARGLAVEDTGALSFAFEGGALGALVISDTVAGPWSWDLTSGDSERFPAHDVDSHRIGGVEASLTLPWLDVWAHDGAREWTTQLSPAREAVIASSPYAGQLRHFGDVVAGRAQPLVSAREGMRNLAVMEAIAASVETGRTVTM